MFDDRTFDNIMSEMMTEFGADVRTDEKSLAYNACAKMASKLEETYGDMSDLSDNMLPDTQDISHLIRYAGERGISYHYATAPVVKGEFSQEIDIGEALTCGDYTYIVKEKITGEDYSYKLECETVGTEANATLGELDPVDYIDDYQGGEITEILVPGTDDEDDEEFRQRVLDSFNSTAFGGNKADYRLFVDAISGVGGCKPKRRASDSPWVNIYVISSEFGVPSSSLIDQIQTAVDPEENHGEGDGMAPICHNVQIIGVTAQTVNVATTVTYDEGYTVEGTQTAIEEAIEGYLSLLRAEWEGNDLNSMSVRISQIEARILTVEGVLDVADTTINGEEENLVITFDKIPTLGEVTINDGV